MDVIVVNKVKVKSKVVPVLNWVPRHEDISCAQLCTTPWRRKGE